MKTAILIAISTLIAYANAATAINDKNSFLKIFEGHTFYVNSVSFSPDGKYIASASGDGAIRIWDASLHKRDKSPGKWIKTFKINSWIETISFSPDGKYIASGSDDGIIRLLNVSAVPRVGAAESKLSKNHVKIFKHTDSVKSLAFSPDGKYIASASGDNTIRLWDISNGKCVKTFNRKLVGEARQIVFSPNGKYIAFAAGETIKMLSVSDSLLKRRFKGHSFIHSISFSPDGKYIVSGNDDGKIELWDVLSEKRLKILKSHLHSIMTVSFSPDGKYIASGGHKIIKFWNISGKCAGIIKGHAFSVMSMSFSPDGKYIVSGSRDKTIKMWLTPWEAKRIELEEYVRHEKRERIFEDERNYKKYFIKGERLLKKGKFRKAIRLFIKASEYRPNDKKTKKKIAYCIKKFNEISLKDNSEKESEEIDEIVEPAEPEQSQARQSRQTFQKTDRSDNSIYYWVIIAFLLLIIVFLLRQ